MVGPEWILGLRDVEIRRYIEDVNVVCKYYLRALARRHVCASTV